MAPFSGDVVSAKHTTHLRYHPQSAGSIFKNFIDKHKRHFIDIIKTIGGRVKTTESTNSSEPQIALC